MKYQRLSQIATLAFFISILNSSAQGSETALLEKLRECQKQITLLERIKEELNAENYDLKNDNGALKAKMLRLIMQNKLLKGEKVEELSEATFLIWLWKQDILPVWHALLVCETIYKIASPSQSTRISWTCWILPLVSPFFQSSFLLREK